MTGFLYSNYADIKNAVLYLDKATEFAKKFNLGRELELNSFQASVFNLVNDYDYTNQDILYKKSLLVNEIISDNPLFSYGNTKRNKKIRIGYISSNFKNNVVMNFIYPILKHHDRNIFEISLFANTEQERIHKKIDDIDAMIYNIHNISSEIVAKKINELEIDILIELDGHTFPNRLDVFAFHPAPIQVSYMGYPNTTGLKSIKYRIIDNISDNPLSKQKFTEKLIRMPNCFLLFESVIFDFNKNIRKTDANEIILGSINRENKSNDIVFDTWKTILQKCPNTKMFIKIESMDDTEYKIKFYSEKLNVDPSRLIICNRIVDTDFENKLFTEFDILLDPFPYSGTTTSCYGLYNSLPIVTLYNIDYHSQNVTSSLLYNCGLNELIAKTREEYINIVVDLVNHPEKIDNYKKTIHDIFIKSMNPKPFMIDYEKILHNLYDNFFDNKMYQIDF